MAPSIHDHDDAKLNMAILVPPAALLSEDPPISRSACQSWCQSTSHHQTALRRPSWIRHLT